MANAKQTMTEIISRQPDDASYDQLLRELAYARTIQRGLDDSDAGRTPTAEEAQKEIDSWRP
ncbi:MAG TPA: hypothetical protein DCQ98_19565 [Planctomycetaceae bacterium]|nr:hypothetical protein [Planctomycetaceae bacterium]HRF00827.1 hypothetical protein [Pirellulaceae bacterium]